MLKTVTPFARVRGIHSKNSCRPKVKRVRTVMGFFISNTFLIRVVEATHFTTVVIRPTKRRRFRFVRRPSNDREKRPNQTKRVRFVHKAAYSARVPRLWCGPCRDDRLEPDPKSSTRYCTLTYALFQN